MGTRFAGDRSALEDSITPSQEAELLDELATSGAPSDEDLSSVSDLAEELLQREQRVFSAERILAEAKKAYDEISTVLLPTALDTLGIAEITLDSGTTIGVDTYYSASIPAESKDEAFDWLEKEGHEGIIKHEVRLSLKKGQAEEAKEATRLLTEAGLEPTVDLKVHPSTLRAFAREEIESGREISPAINVFVGRRSKVR